MSLFDAIRSMFGLSNQQDAAYTYRDAEPHLEPDSEDSSDYPSSQFQNQEFSYVHYELGEDFDYRPHSAEPVHIHYDGLLKNCGADAVYLHYGFDNWDHQTIRTEKMHQQPDGSFYLSINPGHHREINYCFKDSADHWDNNNGWNWIENQFHST